MSSPEQKSEEEESKEGNDKKSSEKLLQLHRDGKRPIKLGEGFFCAYSFDESMPSCIFRGPEEEHIVDGVRRKLSKCYHGGVRSLFESDYDYVEISSIEEEK